MTHIMEKYHDKIRALAEMELVGSRFRAFILRWEQNSAPAPAVRPAETIVEAPLDARRWGQGTNLEAEEESYFNGSDDEEDTAASSQPTASSVTSMTSSQSAMWVLAQQQTTRPVNQRKSPRGAARGAMSPQRTTRSSTAAAQAAAAAAAAAVPRSSPLSPIARPQTPTPSSHVRVGSPIALPQAYPMRSLLDYGEDDNDDEFIGPMPAIEEIDETLAPGPSTSAVATPVIVKSGATAGRTLHRTESVSDLAGLNRAAAVTLQQNGTSVDSSSDIPPSNLRRPRGGSIFGPEAAPNLAVSTSSASSAPPLKRRREEDDEDDLISLMSRATRATRRKSLEAKTSSRSPSPSADAKGKGKEIISVESQNEKAGTGVGEKQGAAKRIRLSLKAALGLGKDSGPTSRSPSPSLSATAGVKDGDGG